jgi:hypothetical protein
MHACPRRKEAQQAGGPRQRLTASSVSSVAIWLSRANLSRTVRVVMSDRPPAGERVEVSEAEVEVHAGQAVVGH